MYNSKLYAILEHFDKYEQNRCRKYIQSPYFNRSEELLELFDILIAVINGENGVNLEKEYLWERIQAGKEYDDIRFRKYCSDLLKLIEGYLAQQAYEENPLHQATYLMEAIGKRKIKKLNSTAIRTSRRLSSQQKYKPSSYYFYQYEVEKNLYQLTDSDLKRSKRNNVEEIANNLDRFYIAEKLRYYCLVLMQQFYISQEYEILLIEEIISQIQKYRFNDIPPIAVYYQIYLTLAESGNEKHYFELIKVLKQYGTQFPPDEAYNIYTYALNYCIGKVNKGQHHFLEEYFKLYQELLENEIIFIDNELSPWDFRNIVFAALRLGKYEWAEQFINDYSEMLPEAFKENAVTFNLAQVFFYQKKYDKVIEQLQNVEYDDVSYNLNSKTMLLATYYETDEIEPLDSLLESFRAYLNRHKDIPANKRRRYLNLIKFTKKISRLIPGDQKAIEKVKSEIESTKGIVSLNWLKEKIADLEG